MQANKLLNAQVLTSLTDAARMSIATTDRWRRTALAPLQIATRAPTSACSIAYPAQVSNRARSDVWSTQVTENKAQQMHQGFSKRPPVLLEQQSDMYAHR